MPWRTHEHMNRKLVCPARGLQEEDVAWRQGAGGGETGTYVGGRGLHRQVRELSLAPGLSHNMPVDHDRDGLGELKPMT